MPISYRYGHVPDQAFVPPYILYRAAPGPRTFARGPVNSLKVYCVAACHNTACFLALLMSAAGVPRRCR
jgi:hypothetical protein